MPCSNDFEEEPYENFVGKGENAGYQYFLPFRQRFLPCEKTILVILSILAHYQTRNFRPFQTERVCRQQFQI